MYLPILLLSALSATTTTTALHHSPMDKPHPQQQSCIVTSTAKSDQLHCSASPGLGTNTVATLTNGGEYQFACWEEAGTCLYNHCEYYKVVAAQQTCYISGYYTDCDKEKIPRC